MVVLADTGDARSSDARDDSWLLRELVRLLLLSRTVENPPPTPPGLSEKTTQDEQMKGFRSLASPGDETHERCDSLLQLPQTSISPS